MLRINVSVDAGPKQLDSTTETYVIDSSQVKHAS